MAISTATGGPLSDAKKAAIRLGVRFMDCAQCNEPYVWNPHETFSVMTNPPDGIGDYDDGNSDIRFCCSHLCASRLVSAVGGDGMIWRGGKCGGSVMPVLDK